MADEPRYVVRTVSGGLEVTSHTSTATGLTAAVLDRWNAWRVVAQYRSEDIAVTRPTDTGGSHTRFGVAGAIAAAEREAARLNAL